MELAAVSEYYVRLAEFRAPLASSSISMMRVDVAAVGHHWLCMLLQALYDERVTLSRYSAAGFLAAAHYLQVRFLSFNLQVSYPIGNRTST